jgi:hypothetical protein
VLQKPDGTPAARAVVRLRGKYMNGFQPVLADSAGRFEIKPQWIPIDQGNGKHAFVQHLVAFDPYRPMAARAEVRLDQPKEIVLELERPDPFWFTGCGSCHADFPSVRLAHELYKDSGVLVTAFHNNSITPEAVPKHVAKIGLHSPFAVDHPGGRTIARFEEHGVPNGYPNYARISPEGKVLLDGRTTPRPSLRTYNLEIIRTLLLESQAMGQ